MYLTISRSVCNEQQLKREMHVVDIRTVCICEEILYVPIWKECINIKICIFVKNKIYPVTTTDIHAKQIIHRIFRIMHLPLEYNYAWFRHMHTCTSQKLSLLTKNWVRQGYVDIVVNMYLWMIYNPVQSFRRLLNNVWPSSEKWFNNE